MCYDENKLSFVTLSLLSNQFDHDPEWVNKCANERPFDMKYGDDTQFSKEETDYIANLHLKYEKLFKWKVGDMLILDNTCWSHARYPFSGDRNIVAMMGYPLTRTKQYFENDQFFSDIDYTQDIKEYVQ